MQAWHQKNLLKSDFPLHIFTADVEFPPHWHEQIELIYVIDEKLSVGLNNEIYTLRARDILIVGVGEVHYFLPQHQQSRRVIIQFDTSLLEQFSILMKDIKIVKPFFSPTESKENMLFDAHEELEKHILEVIRENNEKKEAYRIAIKARICDLMVTLLRHVPVERYSLQEKNKQLIRLERIDQVFNYVEANFSKEITLTEISKVANFSPYHFTRFFKETTGMTFGQYLNSFRVAKAAGYLKETGDPITEVVFKSGFNSIKTFNRVFKNLKGCSPTAFRKSNN
ncbi:MAG TPA: AraC family transcriptional regulator [Clostridia bacterium]|nr:AraC family transcriptional regulator [Clostridia bacterium]